VSTRNSLQISHQDLWGINDVGFFLESTAGTWNGARTQGRVASWLITFFNDGHIGAIIMRRNGSAQAAASRANDQYINFHVWGVIRTH
jgi:Ni,Fe-hydrogenase I cytochrome b subunit